MLSDEASLSDEEYLRYGRQLMLAEIGEAGQARLVQRKSFAGEERAEPAGACPAAAFRREAARWADDSTLRRIVWGTSEQRIQCFEAGQARFVQRKKFAGKPRAGAAAEGVPLRRIAGERPSE